MWWELTEKFISFATRTCSTPSECCCTLSVSKTLSRIFPFFANKSDVPFKYSTSSRKFPARIPKYKQSNKKIDLKEYFSCSCCSKQCVSWNRNLRLNEKRWSTIHSWLGGRLSYFTHLTNSVNAHCLRNVLELKPSYFIIFITFLAIQKENVIVSKPINKKWIRRFTDGFARIKT